MPAPRTSKNKPAASEDGPTADRPHIPGYGIPNDAKGLLPWSHVSERMAKAQHFWVCTVDEVGRPHATPVDGVWLDEQLYFGGQPGTRRNRNLKTNPAVCIHLESAMDVVILHGDAIEVRNADRALAVRLSEASKKKYGYAPSAEQYQKIEGMYAFRPRKVLAWTKFPKDCTRWKLV